MDRILKWDKFNNFANYIASNYKVSVEHTPDEDSDFGPSDPDYGGCWRFDLMGNYLFYVYFNFGEFVFDTEDRVFNVDFRQAAPRESDIEALKILYMALECAFKLNNEEEM